ncbi:hypothetical protein pb186bvf_014739 [Paramecium bursaria]
MNKITLNKIYKKLQELIDGDDYFSEEITRMRVMYQLLVKPLQMKNGKSQCYINASPQENTDGLIRLHLFNNNSLLFFLKLVAFELIGNQIDCSNQKISSDKNQISIFWYLEKNSVLNLSQSNTTPDSAESVQRAVEYYQLLFVIFQQEDIKAFTKSYVQSVYYSLQIKQKIQ